MKCMICGGQTLPGAKLCLPCRAALRRARDDTISELMPLPRRFEGFAYQHAATVSGAFPLARPGNRISRPSTVDDRATPKRARGITSAHLHRAAIALFAAAAGIVAFVALGQMQRDDAEAVTHDAAAVPADAGPAQSRVSPSTLLGAARTETATVSPDAADEVPVVVTPAATLPKDPARAVKPKVAARPSITIDAATVLGPAQAPVIIAAPAPLPLQPAQAAPERPSLASALAQCGGDFFARAGCEQRMRLQFCDGRWGRDTLCPAGIANDHGQ